MRDVALDVFRELKMFERGVANKEVRHAHASESTECS